MWKTKLRRRFAAVVIALAAGFCAIALVPNSAEAAERLTLSNGFDVICDHHATVEGRVRVYLKSAVARPAEVSLNEPSYFELSPESVTQIEIVADPPIEKILAPASHSLAPSEQPLTPADLHQLLRKAGTEHNVDADLLASIVKAESGGNTHATSRAGARGLMQLMPGTAQQLGVSDSFEPAQNVRGGAAYLDSLLTRYHDNISLALAAYNAGPEAVDRYHGVPPYRETRVYVARVVHEFNRRVAARRRSGPGRS